MKKKDLERLKQKIRETKDTSAVNGSIEQPSVVPRRGLPKMTQPKRRGQI